MTTSQNNQESVSQTEKELWPNDLLNRTAEGQWLQRYLINKWNSESDTNKNNFILNINADWGYGKTFFMDNLAKDLRKSGHVVITFDAWKNDMADAPLLAFISSINESLIQLMDNTETKTKFPNLNFSKLKKIAIKCGKAIAPAASGYILKKVGEEAFDIINEQLENESIDNPSENMFFDDTVGDEPSNLESDNSTELNLNSEKFLSSVSTIVTKHVEKSIKNYESKRKSISFFIHHMEQLVSELDDSGLEAPLFIMIDELDRCRPSYAIELLETIKHIFAIKGVYFIVATASDQLCHSITAVYGQNFESARYLKRFFHQEYKLAKPEQKQYIQTLWENQIKTNTIFEALYNSTVNDYGYCENGLEAKANIELIDSIATLTHSSLRDIEHAITIIQSISLGNSKKLAAPIIYFLIFISIRHADIYDHIKKSWPYTKFSDKDSHSDTDRQFIQLLNKELHSNQYISFIRYDPKRASNCKNLQANILETISNLIKYAINPETHPHTEVSYGHEVFIVNINQLYESESLELISEYLNILEQAGRMN
ncbi:KAP family P-loop NTPase fold protein [Marinicellulosiphila megalodicopiae]|uniref:KAP family P-loop NTPase fold protein n=1 Tax=Marinicellulosiphila megalodicopiae TaxID=2724896 RepID=UPI003BAEB57D